MNPEKYIKLSKKKLFWNRKRKFQSAHKEGKNTDTQKLKLDQIKFQKRIFNKIKIDQNK